MALAFPNLGVNATPDINSSTDATSYLSASWSPPTTGIIVAFVTSRIAGGPTTPTMSGNGLTWTQFGTTVGNAAGTSGSGISVFAALAAGATTGQTTVSFGASTQTHCTVSFSHVTGVDVSGGLAAAIVQVVTGNVGTVTEGTLTFAAAGNSNNRQLAGFNHITNEASTPRANWTELDDMAGAGGARSLITEFRLDTFETTATASWATSSGWSGIGIELKAEGGGIAGTASITLDGATLAATGVVALNATASSTLAAATLSATGTLSIAGSASVTLTAATVAATGTLAITGSASPPLADATLTATGSVALAGTAAVTLADATLSATATLAIAGTAGVPLADATLAATGSVAIAGALSATLADATLEATGTMPAEEGTGELTVTLEAATLTATATLAIAGTLSTTLDDATLVATGELVNEILGAASIPLADATLAATGTLSITAQVAVTLANATLSGVSSLTIGGVLNVQLANATLNAVGVEVVIVALVQGTVRGVGKTGSVRGVAGIGTVRGMRSTGSI